MKKLICLIMLVVTAHVLEAQSDKIIQKEIDYIAGLMDLKHTKAKGERAVKESCVVVKYAQNREILMAKSKLSRAEFLRLEKQIVDKILSMDRNSFSKEYYKLLASKDPNVAYAASRYHDHFMDQNRRNQESAYGHLGDVLNNGAAGAGLGAGIGGGIGLAAGPEGIPIGAAIGGYIGGIVGVFGTLGSKVGAWLAGGGQNSQIPKTTCDGGAGDNSNSDNDNNNNSSSNNSGNDGGGNQGSGSGSNGSSGGGNGGN